ncbi:hypothetical protein C474_15109 [Halogeometricum pallidum JCM 14848]|uniref:DUF7344 domain-containing protein n=1 Tax=Halogeometricum pallidum JCM 14848 TaxID=1227487 RepID=M0D0P9_HALPD|nr:hypothetical protein [Halogeometricum pallidum]ELZ28448.1 hypothetical protein C474_15109 [Halogeometricum pallidum JCM 14848]
MPLATQPSPPSGGAEISENDLYEMLGNPRRRHALRYLRRCDRPVSVGELAEHVAAAEHDVPVSEVTQAQRKSAYTALHQNHLVKLADAGFVRADRRWAGIELTAAARRLDTDLVGPERTRRLDRYSVALSLAGLAAVLGRSLGLLPTAAVDAALCALFVTLLLLAVRRRRAASSRRQ